MRRQGPWVSWIIFLIVLCGSRLAQANASKVNVRWDVMQDRGLERKAEKDLTLRVVKREIMRRLSSCPEDCNCDVFDNENKVVDCFNVGLVDIPQDIAGDVVTLNMSRNIIMTVKAGLLDNLRDISILDFSHNKIKEIQRGAFKDLTKMKFLDLSYNTMKNISLDDLRQTALDLEVLNISSTGVREIPELYDISGLYMSKLVHLSMANNFFTSIPPSHIPTSVKFLDLSCLNMRVLMNTGLSGLDLLEELIIRGCPLARGRLKAVEHRALATSVRLKRLDLAENDISSVPSGLPSSLEFLDLSNNKITTIKQGECATEADMQAKLYITSQNEYDEFGDGRLTRAVGSALSVLKNLRELRLNGNPIASLCMDEFVNMDKLEILNMSGCRLSSFHSHTFVYPSSLQILDLSRNQLMNFKTADLSVLEELYLEYNILEKVDLLDRRKVPSLLKADLSGNPWRCDCSIQPLLHLLAYSNDIKFINLHAYSVYYACSVPQDVKGKPLMSLNFDTDVKCGEEGGINIVAIAAPASIGAIIIIIVIVVIISTRRDAKKRAALRAERGEPYEEKGCCSCCCACCCRRSPESYSKRITDTRRNFDYPSDSLVRKNALLNDAAILCNVKDQKWILNKMIPEVHRYRAEGEQHDKKKKQNPIPPRKLSMNVFTIGQTIKIERLSKCIDSNRKIVLLITHNFVEEETCILVLNVIRERMVRDPKDSVILLILDAIAWSTMPQCLQFLMVEKTFVQFPQDARGRQEFYFWDSVCSHMYSKSLRSLLPPVEEETENLAFDAEEEGMVRQNFGPAVVNQRHLPTDDGDIFPPMRPAGWNTGGRRGKGMSMNMNDQFPMTQSRQEKLKRLGLQRDGNLVDEAYGGIAEARNLGRAQKMSYELQGGKVQDTNLPMQHIESIRKSQKDDIASVHQDIDDLYSTRGSLPTNRAPTSGRIRTLLPAHAGDADSIYSEDEEIAAQMIKAPERQRSNLSRSSHLHSGGGVQVPSMASDNAFVANNGEPFARNVSAEHLHGTDKNFRSPEFASQSNLATADDPIPTEPDPTTEDPEEDESEDDESKKKKKKKKKDKKNKQKSKKKEKSK